MLAVDLAFCCIATACVIMLIVLCKTISNLQKCIIYEVERANKNVIFFVSESVKVLKDEITIPTETEKKRGANRKARTEEQKKQASEIKKLWWERKKKSQESSPGSATTKQKLDLSDPNV